MAVAGNARAASYDGTWQVTGPATCPFRLVMTVAGPTITMNTSAQNGSATGQAPLGPDGSFAFRIDAPFFTTGNGRFSGDTVEMMFQSSRCGTVKATGKRTS